MTKPKKPRTRGGLRKTLKAAALALPLVMGGAGLGSTDALAQRTSILPGVVDMTKGCSVVTCPDVVKEAIKTSSKFGSGYALVGAFMCIMDVALGDKLPTQGILSEMRTVCYHLGEFSKRHAVDVVQYEFSANCRNGDWRVYATPHIEMDVPRQAGMPEKQGVRFMYKLDGLAPDGSAQYVNAKIVGDGEQGGVKIQIELGEPEAITSAFKDEAAAVRYLQTTQAALAPFNAIYNNLETTAVGDDRVIARVPIKAFTDNGANFQVARDWRAKLADTMLAVSDRLREHLLPVLKADGTAPTKRVTLTRSPAGM